jgi:hypothetical protein
MRTMCCSAYSNAICAIMLCWCYTKQELRAIDDADDMHRRLVELNVQEQVSSSNTTVTLLDGYINQPLHCNANYQFTVTMHEQVVLSIYACSCTASYTHSFVTSTVNYACCLCSVTRFLYMYKYV